MTALSPNEIRARAAAFAAEWKGARREEAEAQSFQNDFFHIFGIQRRKVAIFEHKVKCLDAATGYIDLFWKGHIIIEMKSQGKDREKAYRQARRYADSLPPHDVPHAILICDFEHWDFYDLDKGGEKTSFSLSELPEHIHLFLYLAGYSKREYLEEDPVNVQAAELMGRLHDALKATGYEGHPLEVYLVRLLFCLFADDTGIFNKDDFLFFIKEHTSEDGDDLAARLAELFQVLNTPESKRLKGRNEQLAAFPYVNGGLFAEMLPMPAFDAGMRCVLLECCSLDWGGISPAIFGSMFQSVMKPEERRALGAHYTSERNILKLINPLFMDDLRQEFQTIRVEKNTRRRKNKLQTFRDKLASLTFLDPACGCGNFLVVSYRELRLLELEVLQALVTDGQRVLDVSELCRVQVHQFYGIEIEEFPAQIAQVALWLIDHQMNRLVGEHFGQYFARIPLRDSATIVCGNALRLDWSDIVPKEKLSYILGNPPFAGTTTTSAEQKADIREIFNHERVGYLDYVACWYMKAARFMQGNTTIRAAFVSTNSITQGEQVYTLWSRLKPLGGCIDFAWQTFKWSNEASGAAAVHCVIIGFSTGNRTTGKKLYSQDLQGNSACKETSFINGYLMAGVDAVVKGISAPLSAPKRLLFGNKPTDGGHLILTPEEKMELIGKEPTAVSFLRPYFGGAEFINHVPANGEADRYCIWLKDVPLASFARHPLIMERVRKCGEMRRASKAASTRDYASKAHLFRQIAQKGDENFIALPAITSERREYVPLGFMKKGTIASNKLYIILNATLYDFAILSSRMHMVWMKVVCGRLKSDYSYSSDLCYNTFAWPENVTDRDREKIEQQAQAVLDVRSQNPTYSLGELYNPELFGISGLEEVHRRLDAAVEKLYRKAPFADDAERVAFLFARYQELTTSTPKKN